MENDIPICTFAGLVQRVTGFGGGIVMMLFLPTLFGIPQSAGISVTSCIVLCILMVYKYREYINVKEMINPAILYCIVSCIAIVFSKSVNQTYMKLVLGLFLIFLCIYFLFVGNKKIELIIQMKLFAIIFSGICDGLLRINSILYLH